MLFTNMFNGMFANDVVETMNFITIVVNNVNISFAMIAVSNE